MTHFRELYMAYLVEQPSIKAEPIMIKYQINSWKIMFTEKHKHPDCVTGELIGNWQNFLPIFNLVYLVTLP